MICMLGPFGPLLALAQSDFTAAKFVLQVQQAWNDTVGATPLHRVDIGGLHMRTTF